MFLELFISVTFVTFFFKKKRKCFGIDLRFVTVIIFLKMVLQKSRERFVAKVRGFLGRGSTVSRCWKVWGDIRVSKMVVAALSCISLDRADVQYAKVGDTWRSGE